MRFKAITLIGALFLLQGSACGDDDGATPENGSLSCQDGLDNDGDGLIDCNDPDCLVQSWCAANQETLAMQCSDGIDNDNDGFIDCEDPSCSVNDFCENCAGCRIGPTCFDSGIRNPANQCQTCKPESSTDAWTDNDGAGCDDGSYCNGADTCAAGACSQHSGNPCTANESCDETSFCTCPGCRIAGECILDGTVNPNNGCQVCDQATEDATWTDDDGAACDDGTYCNGTDTCSGGACGAHTGDPCTAPETCDEGGEQCVCPGCSIGGTCYVDASPNPSNECEVCNVSASTTAWTNNDGAACNDGTFCNGPDTCSGGTCSVHPGDPCVPFGCDETNDVCLAQDINVTDGVNDLPDGSGVYSYGQVVVGGAPRLHTFVIENTGNLALTLTSVAITSGNASDFTLDTGAMVLTVPASGSTTFDLTFDPQSLGAKSVELTILSDDPDEGTYTLTAQGTGAAQPTNTWTNLGATGLPNARFNHSLVHVGNNTLILFGGKDAYSDYLSETWQFDIGTSTWTQLSPVANPGLRDAQDMVYVGGDTVILFGGKDDWGTALGDTWEYDVAANTWTQLTPANAPAIRFKHRLVYIGGDLVILYGGRDDWGTAYSDTWEYDVAANTWTQLTTTGTPPMRHGHGMAFGGNNNVILHGGVDLGTYSVLTDTWEYSVATSTWTQIAPAATPGPRMAHSMVYLDSGLVLLFSGKDDYASDPIAGTWVYSVSAQTWTNMSPTGPPSPIFSYGIAGIGTGSAILFGGAQVDTGGTWNTATWRYDY
ncbi:MAG: kelch repeat-containing protein [bacterium]